jgi:hypothetical protein
LNSSSDGRLQPSQESQVLPFFLVIRQSSQAAAASTISATRIV